MTTIEAFNFTMKKVYELRDSGIVVTIKASSSKDDIELVKKYCKSNRIPPEYWSNVSFNIENKEQALKIHETANYLGLLGINFDTGGCMKCRDWELDWSFTYDENYEDWERRIAREKVENLICILCQK